jgi:hypothetical protein
MVLALAGDSTITSDLAIRLNVPCGTILRENQATANSTPRVVRALPS